MSKYEAYKFSQIHHNAVNQRPRNVIRRATTKPAPVFRMILILLILAVVCKHFGVA